MSEFNPDIFEQSKEREKAFLRFAQKFGFLNDGFYVGEGDEKFDIDIKKDGVGRIELKFQDSCFSVAELIESENVTPNDIYILRKSQMMKYFAQCEKQDFYIMICHLWPTLNSGPLFKSQYFADIQAKQMNLKAFSVNREVKALITSAKHLKNLWKNKKITTGKIPKRDRDGNKIELAYLTTTHFFVVDLLNCFIKLNQGEKNLLTGTRQEMEGNCFEE